MRKRTETDRLGLKKSLQMRSTGDAYRGSHIQYIVSAEEASLNKQPHVEPDIESRRAGHYEGIRKDDGAVLRVYRLSVSSAAVWSGQKGGLPPHSLRPEGLILAMGICEGGVT